MSDEVPLMSDTWGRHEAMTEPRTEAGRALVQFFGNLNEGDQCTLTEFAAAIEAEARAEALQDTECVDAYDHGRADALREAAERVRALPIPAIEVATRSGYKTIDGLDRAAVLAILEAESVP